MSAPEIWIAKPQFQSSNQDHLRFKAKLVLSWIWVIGKTKLSKSYFLPWAKISELNKTVSHTSYNKEDYEVYILFWTNSKGEKITTKEKGWKLNNVNLFIFKGIVHFEGSFTMKHGGVSEESWTLMLSAWITTQGGILRGWLSTGQILCPLIVISVILGMTFLWIYLQPWKKYQLHFFLLLMVTELFNGSCLNLQWRWSAHHLAVLFEVQTFIKGG
jgi:hypothetical protein